MEELLTMLQDKLLPQADSMSELGSTVEYRLLGMWWPTQRPNSVPISENDRDNWDRDMSALEHLLKGGLFKRIAATARSGRTRSIVDE